MDNKKEDSKALFNTPWWVWLLLGFMVIGSIVVGIGRGGGCSMSNNTQDTPELQPLDQDDYYYDIGEPVTTRQFDTVYISGDNITIIICSDNYTIIYGE